jgi:LysM repeat protein
MSHAAETRDTRVLIACFACYPAAMAQATCHYCSRPPVAECHTCGRLYCAEHGEDVCLRCLSPEAATPSPLIFRGALLALLVGTALAIFLVIRPPESASKADTPRTVPSSTIAGAPTATPTPPGGNSSRTPAASATASKTTAGSATASATATAATATATGTAVGAQQYTVRAGDSLNRIATQFNITQQQLIDANPGVTETIQIGQVLNIPAPR